MYLKINYNYNFTAFIYRQFFGQTPKTIDFQGFP